MTLPQFVCNATACSATMSMKSLREAVVEIAILLETGVSTPCARQLEVLQSFASLDSAELFDGICRAARRYIEVVEESIDLEEEGIFLDRKNLSNHFQFNEVVIPSHGECETDFVFLNADCDWEPEHGMQLWVIDGHVKHCGPCSAPFWSAPFKNLVKIRDERMRMERLAEFLKKL